MFTRLVEIKAQRGKADEVVNLIQDKVLPILRQQNGFVDEIALVSTTQPDRVIGMSFWRTQEDAERYHRENFPKISELLRPHIQGAPEVQNFNLHASTAHKITAGKAA